MAPLKATETFLPLLRQIQKHIFLLMFYENQDFFSKTDQPNTAKSWQLADNNFGSEQNFLTSLSSSEFLEIKSTMKTFPAFIAVTKAMCEQALAPGVQWLRTAKNLRVKRIVKA